MTVLPGATTEAGERGAVYRLQTTESGCSPGMSKTQPSASTDKILRPRYDPGTSMQDDYVICFMKGIYTNCPCPSRQSQGHWVYQVQRAVPSACCAEHDDDDVGDGKAMEREANVFTAKLLMPEGAETASFAGDLRRTGDFRVSEQAIVWRAFNVGLVAVRPK